MVQDIPLGDGSVIYLAEGTGQYRILVTPEEVRIFRKEQETAWSLEFVIQRQKI